MSIIIEPGNIKDQQNKYILQVVNAKVPFDVYVMLATVKDMPGVMVFTETKEKKDATRFTELRADQFIRTCKEKLVFGIIELEEEDTRP